MSMMPHRRTVAALCALLPCLPLGAQTQTFVSRTVVAPGGRGLPCGFGPSVLDVAQSIDVTCSANLGGGVPSINRGVGSATPTGVLRSRTALAVASAPGGYTFAPRSTITGFQASGVIGHLSLQALGAAPTAASIVLWMAMDGTLTEVAGTSSIPGAIQNDVYGAVFFNAGSGPNTSALQASPNTGFTVTRGSPQYQGTITSTGWVTGTRTTLVNAIVGSDPFQVVNGGIDFGAFLGTSATMHNTASTAVTLSGLSLDADFSHTARLVAAQVFDASGVDISTSYRVGAEGLGVLQQGMPTLTATPEPATFALCAVGLALVGGVATRRRQRAGSRESASSCST